MQKITFLYLVIVGYWLRAVIQVTEITCLLPKVTSRTRSAKVRLVYKREEINRFNERRKWTAVLFLLYGAAAEVSRQFVEGRKRETTMSNCASIHPVSHCACLHPSLRSSE